MARLFTDGAEFGDTRFWTGNAYTVSTAIKRSGVYSHRVDGYNCYKTVGNGLSEYYYRVGLYTDNISYGFQLTQKLTGYTTNVVRIQTSSATSSRVAIIIDDATKAYSTVTLSSSTWYLIEVYVKLHRTTGVVTVKLDGTEIVTWTGDTLGNLYTNYGKSTIDTFYYLVYGAAYLDDLALNDTTGSTDNSWCGDGRVILLMPNGDGDVTQMTNSAGTQVNNYSYVDEIPSTGDTDYVCASGTGTYDLYALTNPTISGVTIQRVWVEARARETVAESGVLKAVMKINGVEYDSEGQALITTYTPIVFSGYVLNPNTLTTWAISDLTDLQIGPKVG
jgi:hypothetical protein